MQIQLLVTRMVFPPDDAVGKGSSDGQTHTSRLERLDLEELA